MTKSSIAIIVDDHGLFLESIASLIEKMNVFEEVIAYKNTNELFHTLLHNDYKIIYLFLDYFLENSVSISFIKDAKRISPRIKIVMVTSLTNPGTIKKILAQGPNGFISKSSNFEVILDCLKAIEKKRQYVCPVINKILDSDQNIDVINFTNRELELLELFNHGYSIEKTAEIINLSKHTIVAHRRNMMKKANCNSIQELLWHAKEQGIL